MCLAAEAASPAGRLMYIDHTIGTIASTEPVITVHWDSSIELLATSATPTIVSMWRINPDSCSMFGCIALVFLLAYGYLG